MHIFLATFNKMIILVYFEILRNKQLKEQSGLQ